MINILKFITNFFINPVNLLFVFGTLALFFHYKRMATWVRRLLFISFFYFLLVATPFLPDLLIANLEEKYTALDLASLKQDEFYDILVLGSGHTLDPDVPAIAQLSATALQRLNEGVRVFNHIQNADLILSGYGNLSDRSQAEVLSNAALSLGIPADKIKTQKTPSNTEEEAEAYGKTIQPQHLLILVTSASHMPRAMYLFRKHGLNPVPAPTAYEVLDDPEIPFEWDFFASRNFTKVEMALHEYLGMLWARW